MPNNPLAEIRAGFFAECEELLETLHDSIAALNVEAPDADLINTIFRAVHSIKGGAAAFGYERLVDFAHRYEGVLGGLRTDHSLITESMRLMLMQASDALEDHVESARGATSPPTEGDSILAELQMQLGQVRDQHDQDDFFYQPVALDLSTLGVETAAWQVVFAPQGSLYSNGNEPLFLLRALRTLGATDICCLTEGLDSGLAEFDPMQPALSWRLSLPAEIVEADIREVFEFVDGLCVLTISRQPRPDPWIESATIEVIQPSPEANPAPSPRQKTDTIPIVRVDLERVDRLMNLVGELVINQAMLAQSVADAGIAPNSPVMTGLEAFTKLTREVQDSVMMIRAQPVKPLFLRMSRLVREAAISTGKQIQLITIGEATEVDKTVIERLTDPLTHMIRNAIDHGIEPPAMRLAAGKHACGTITLKAQHRSGRLMIELRDDGAGIDRAKVMRIAISRGLIAGDSPQNENEIDNLLFMPGFSTANSISPLSGRGVGLDVVRLAIHGLGGRVSIQSQPGEGTVFTISLPLTLAVLDGMIVRVADQTLVIPLSSILETAALEPNDVRAIGSGLSVLELRGGFLPLFDLGVELGFRAPIRHDDGGIVLLTRHEDESRSALIVDTIVEQRQVVIKGLHRHYGHIHGISAATILGNGQVALIVDPTDLLSRPPLPPSDMAIAG